MPDQRSWSDPERDTLSRGGGVYDSTTERGWRILFSQVQLEDIIMGTQRTSQKDVLEAIQQLTAVVTQLVQQPTAAPEPVAQPAKADTVKVDKGYLAKMQPKWQQLADRKGLAYVGFAYRKSNGQLGLWACPKTEYAKASSRSNFIGAIMEINPS